MKKVVEVSIGKMKFTLEEDAYTRLRDYLRRFESTMTNPLEAKDVMEDVEIRVAEILTKEQSFPGQVISTNHISSVVSHLGEVEDLEEEAAKSGPKKEPLMDDFFASGNFDKNGYELGDKRFFRDMENKTFGGVCSGLSAYFGLDVTLIRVFFVVLAFAYGSAAFLYVGFWLVAPKALTVSQKLQMRGYAPTAENIRRYAFMYKQ